MKINVGGEYKIDSDLMIPFFEYKEGTHKDDILTYLGKYFLYTISEITGESTYEDAYIFYSEEKKAILYVVQRQNFALESEFDVNPNFINYKDNRLFVNNKSVKNMNKNKGKLHTIWIDEDDFANNKEFIDSVYRGETSYESLDSLRTA